MKPLILALTVSALVVGQESAPDSQQTRRAAELARLQRERHEADQKKFDAEIARLSKPEKKPDGPPIDKMTPDEGSRALKRYSEMIAAWNSRETDRMKRLAEMKRAKAAGATTMAEFETWKQEEAVRNLPRKIGQRRAVIGEHGVIGWQYLSDLGQYDKFIAARDATGAIQHQQKCKAFAIEPGAEVILLEFSGLYEAWQVRVSKGGSADKVLYVSDLSIKCETRIDSAR
jgi:hypothetical protein